MEFTGANTFFGKTAQMLQGQDGLGNLQKILLKASGAGAGGARSRGQRGRTWPGCSGLLSFCKPHDAPGVCAGVRVRSS